LENAVSKCKIQAIKYARENICPFRICLGLQCAVIEFARDVCGLEDANSTEFEKTKNNVIDLMENQRNYRKSGTMRLGAYPAILEKGTIAYRAYNQEAISERHRHRYEINNQYRDLLSAKGMFFSGKSPDGQLVEIAELKGHPWFLGVQFHPELNSRAITGTIRLFIDFIKTALAEKRRKKKFKLNK
jgi:CTP synthase